MVGRARMSTISSNLFPGQRTWCYTCLLHCVVHALSLAEVEQWQVRDRRMC